MKMLDLRRNEFKNQLWAYVKGKGGLDKYPKENLKDFYDYWSEHNEPVRSNTKMRFEMEKIFNIGRRLGTWFKNVKPEPVKNHAFMRNETNEVYRQAGPVKTKEQLKEEERQIEEMEAIYEAKKQSVVDNPVGPRSLRMGGFTDPNYLKFKKQYEEKRRVKLSKKPKTDSGRSALSNDPAGEGRRVPPGSLGPDQDTGGESSPQVEGGSEQVDKTKKTI